ncbi:hypothetical protein [Proteus terrae]|uniref:hypothetical protein n=1 Tax=Proteus terrae TaxID=1574161 RepID=UPI0013001DBC|nr:hypothetical protein [Proteus terrae]
MPILIGLIALVFIYLYIKSKKFRGLTNQAIKKSPDALKQYNEQMRRELEKRNNK